MTCDTDFSCPQPENYAAIAKQLHQTALQAEQRIYCLERAVRAATNLPTAISLKTANTFQIVPNLEGIIFDRWNSGDYTGLFANSPMQISSGMRYPAGIYQMGIYVDAVAVGAVTTNSYRAAIIEVHETTATIPTGQYVKRADETFQDPNNGLGNWICVETVQRIEEGNFVAFKFFHQNASDMSIAVNSLAWMTKLSDLNVTQVL